MRYLCLLAIVGFAAAAGAAPLELLVDFGGSVQAPTLGGTWNTLGSANMTLTTVRDSSGSILGGVSIESVGWTDTDDMVGAQAWSKDWVDAAAVMDYNWIRMGSMPGVIVRGLPSGQTYDVELAASLESTKTGSWVADYKVNLTDAVAPPSDDSSLGYDPLFDGRVERDILRWQNVALNGSGQLFITVHTSSPSYQGALNAMRITPEPGALILVCAAAPILLARRRRT